MKTYKLEIVVECENDKLPQNILGYLDFQCNRGEGYFYFTDSAKIKFVKETEEDNK